MLLAEGEKPLQQTELKGKVKDVLENLYQWIAEAYFKVADSDKSEKLEICDDPGFDKASQRLLIDEDFRNCFLARDDGGVEATAARTHPPAGKGIGNSRG